MLPPEATNEESEGKEKKKCRKWEEFMSEKSCKKQDTKGLKEGSAGKKSEDCVKKLRAKCFKS